MTDRTLRRLTIADVTELTGRSDYAGNCHGMSLALVRIGVYGPDARVARGFCSGVRSQHSWVAVGDPYDEDTPIVDPTLWTYREDVEDIWYGSRRHGWHMPHGAGSIWNAGRPIHRGGETIVLDTAGLSRDARSFVDILGPLDFAGWRTLFHLPVEGWPAGEILDRALDQIPNLEASVSIDIIGMVTDRNPGDLYR